MASTPNDPFVKPLLITGLVLLAAAIFVLVSNLFSTIQANSTVGLEDDTTANEIAQSNLSPVGKVLAVDKSIAPQARTGEAVYNAVCTACHTSGVLDAPKLEKSAWTERIANGLQGLLGNAINGINQMPPRGGDPSLTDEEMESSILYMMAQAGVELEQGDTTAAGKAMAAETAESAQDQVPEQAAPVVQSSIDGQAVYQGICFSCHDSGVANAPKPGDKAVWETRLANGIDTLYTSVINGKGAMPPKGGNPALSEDEIKSAVDWMIAQ